MMDINFWTILIIWSIHFIADFMLQTHEDATNKWHSLRHLWNHVSTYSIVTGIAWGFTVGLDWHWSIVSLSIGAAFATHFVTDYFTSKWSHHFFAKEDFHNGFVIVGLDQLIHLATLLASYVFIDHAIANGLVPWL